MFVRVSTTFPVACCHTGSLASVLFSGPSPCWPSGSGTFYSLCLEYFIMDLCDMGSFLQFQFSVQISFPQKYPFYFIFLSSSMPHPAITIRSPNLIVFKVFIIMFVTEHHHKHMAANWPVSWAWALGDSLPPPCPGKVGRRPWKLHKQRWLNPVPFKIWQVGAGIHSSGCCPRQASYVSSPCFLKLPTTNLEWPVFLGSLPALTLRGQVSDHP